MTDRVATISANWRALFMVDGFPRFRLRNWICVLKLEHIDVLLQWLMHLRITDGLRPNSIATYGKHVHNFLVWMEQGGNHWSAVSVDLIDAWQRSLYMEHNWSPSTRNQALVSVRRFYAWRQRSTGAHNPVSLVREARIPKRQPKKYSPDELRRFFTSFDRSLDVGCRDYALFLLYYATGGRTTEVCTLRLDQLRITTNTGRVEFFGKGAKERTVSFEGQAVHALRHWLARRDQLRIPGDALFPRFITAENPTGDAMDPGLPRKLIKTYAEDSGQNRALFSMHKLRSTYATSLYDSGVDLLEIQKLMGHAKIETTGRYIAISERMQTVRLGAAHLADITGEADPRTPLWLRQKQKPQPHGEL